MEQPSLAMPTTTITTIAVQWVMARPHRPRLQRLWLCSPKPVSVNDAIAFRCHRRTIHVLMVRCTTQADMCRMYVVLWLGLPLRM
jgi:hypothetical protein